jgi:hypothetical protein
MATTITILIYLFQLYLVIGLAFALVFVFGMVHQLDTGAKGTSIWFRLIIIPGSIALWPVLLLKWIKRSKN